VYDALVQLAADVSSSTDSDASVFQDDVIALLALVQKEAKVEQFAWRLVEPVNRPMWPWLQFVLGRVVAVNQPMAPWLRLLLSRVVMLFGGLAAAVIWAMGLVGVLDRRLGSALGLALAVALDLAFGLERDGAKENSIDLHRYDTAAGLVK
jgi:hypothetical protein